LAADDASPVPRPFRLAAQASRPHLVHGRGYVALVAGVVLALAGLVVVGISVGAVSLPLDDVWRILWTHATGHSSDSIDDDIVWNFRTPRVLLAVLVGAGLAVAGTVLQAVVHNPLADPYILGVSSGASLGAVAVLTLGSAAIGGLGVSGAAFLGAIGALLLVLVLGQRSGRIVPTRLVLAGVAIGYLLAAGTSYLQIRATPDKLAGVLFWLLGSLTDAGWADLGIPAVTVVLCTAWLVLQGRRLNLLLMGEETATSLGTNVRRFRIELLVVSALLTGTVISVAGGVGFVGLMIPHIVRLLVGPDHRRVLPLSALLGGAYLLLVDIGARTLSRPLELPLGILTAVLGVPFLLWLLRRDTPSRRVD
jgi:iron complex transport system permease protein